MEFELVISNGTVIDGTGKPRFRADVGIVDRKIATVAVGEQLRGAKTIDATDMVIAPGFIDVHSHFDWTLPSPDHVDLLAPCVLQGITTVVTGNCGSSPAPVTDASIPVMHRLSNAVIDYDWRSVGSFLDVLEQRGVLFNTAFLVGHGAIRAAVMAERAETSVPTEAELAGMVAEVRKALHEGAIGLSTGLGYTPGMFAQHDELATLVRTATEEGGIYAVHGRAYGALSSGTVPAHWAEQSLPHVVLSYRDELNLARETGARLQLSHLIFVGRNSWSAYKITLQDIEDAVAEGVDVAFDAFPYPIGNTTIRVLYPGWFLNGFERNIQDPVALQRVEEELKQRLETVGRGFRDIYLMWGVVPELAALEGLDFATIADRLGRPPFDAYAYVARQSGGKARILHGPMSGDWEFDEPLRAVLSHRLCALMTDTIVLARGKPNPATYGSFPRILGHFCRDVGLFSLEEAVRRMTSFSADRFGLRHMGRVAPGNWADLVVFDPATVADNNTEQRWDAPPSGIKAVLISGEIVAEDGKLVGKQRVGRVIRHS